ncbi:stage II sporulation protein P [Candidatus Arthromitus sp. SFB-rat-Yit]|uniref:stage II sporulation protein P n=1 Tax=Candidatus Arthromitus sp. SFB-rat-Yit TaxID=1041504 RepID=UPI000227A192|nr:stage II sporulation protein P [Candidatus Arthromitus sp. SFB-rat-Yit]BAK81362.1 stage II sporulation protein P [Candidatus Arthromitus sp. SFB-rat-Yit]
MQLTKKYKINLRDFKIIGIVTVVSIIILWIILKTYITYFNISGNFNYAYSSILKNNYMAFVDGEYFENSKEAFIRDIKNILGIDLMNPISIIEKEINILKSSDINEMELSSNMYNNSSQNLNSDDKTTNGIVNLNNTQKRILIYHTHTTEAFKPAQNDSFYEQYNIVGVGDVLKTELEKNYNIKVIHDKTIHNTSYLESYKRSAETLDKYLSEIEDFDLILDLHRDSLENKNLVTANIEGKNVAKIMFVVAHNNPNYLDNEELAMDLTSLANDLYPGFARSVFHYESGSNAFNQTKSSKLALIEMGAQLNTMEEAINSAKLLSNVIGEYLAQ